MKKRIFFILTSAINIVASVFAILDAKELAKAFSEASAVFSGEMQERVTSLYQNSGGAFIIIMAIVTLLLNYLVIYFAFSNKLLKKKGAVITCNALTYFFGNYQIMQIIAVINIIVILILKREKPEDFPDKVKELPMLEKEKINLKKIIGGIVLVLVYFSQFWWSQYIPEKGLFKVLISIAFYVSLILISIIIFFDLYRENFKVFIKNFRTYLKHLTPKVGIFYLIYMVIAFLALFLARNSVAANQSAVEALPLYVSIPLAIIYAPIVEEALFRGVLRRFIRNDIIFIIVSALSFGLLHTVFSEVTLYNMLVMAIPYVIIGAFLAYLYVKTNNICTNMAFHAFQNTLAMIITILIKI